MSIAVDVCKLETSQKRGQIVTDTKLREELHFKSQLEDVLDIERLPVGAVRETFELAILSNRQTELIVLQSKFKYKHCI